MSDKKEILDLDIEWTTEKRLISELNPHPRNPRSISKRSYENLCNSLKKYNYAEIALINLDNTILAGHQRIHVLQDLGRGEEEIEVRVPSRKLTNKEADNYLIVSNKVTGDFDFDILANQWEEEELIEGGFLKEEIYGSERDFEQETDEKDCKDLDLDQKPIVEITCDSQEHQQRLYEEFTKRGLECRVLNL